MQVIGNAISIFGLFLVYSVTLGDRGYLIHGLNWGNFLMIGTLGFVIAGTGQWLTTSAMKSKQKKRDRAARNDFVAPEKEKFSDCALFLRPFDISGEFVMMKQATGSPFDLEPYTHPGTDSLERFLADAFASTARFVGLGGRGDVEFGLSGAGLVEDWQNKIGVAMDGAAYILIVPASNPGTLWEVGQIKSRGHFAKTIFVMPPSVSSFRYTGKMKYAAQWSEACSACADAHGLLLPPYDENGLLFQFDPPSLTLRTAAFSAASPRSLARSINVLLG